LSLLPAAIAPAVAQDQVLVFGMDTSDTKTFDPARQAQYSPPLALHAAYDTLVTMAAGDYVTIRPALAESWERTEDGTALIFHLREGVKFASGNPLTAADVKFSLDRLQNLKDQPAEYAENLKSTQVIDDHTVRLDLVDKNQPLLRLLVAVPFAIYDSKLVQEHGGTAAADAEQTDSATEWLNQNSAGAGPYVLTGWTRESAIMLERNPNYWRGMPPFERVVIRHMSDSATQLLTLEQGDIDVAMNLTPEQLDAAMHEDGIELHEATSLDYMYMTLTSGAEINEALANRACRQAVAHAIDYDGIIDGLLGGYATRPAAFIPVGLAGSTPEIAEQYRDQLDPDLAKQLLAECGHPDGFAFELNYAKAAIAGTSYDIVAQKVASDLGKVNITAQLSPLSQVTLIDRYRGTKTTQSVLTFWNPDAPEAYLWSQASVYRVADRVHWDVPQELRDVVFEAAGAQDPKEQDELYLEYTKALLEEANYIVLFQPVYRIATRSDIVDYKPTAAGWHVDIFDVKPKG
jgi:peptide/nickel transport system substrate-binding protein